MNVNFTARHVFGTSLVQPRRANDVRMHFSRMFLEGGVMARAIAAATTIRAWLRPAGLLACRAGAALISTALLASIDSNGKAGTTSRKHLCHGRTPSRSAWRNRRHRSRGHRPAGLTSICSCTNCAISSAREVDISFGNSAVTSFSTCLFMFWRREPRNLGAAIKYSCS